MLFLERQDPAHRFIDALPGDFPLLRELKSRIDHLLIFIEDLFVHHDRKKQHVCTGTYGQSYCIFLCEIVCDSCHTERIGHDNPMKPHVIPEYVR